MKNPNSPISKIKSALKERWHAPDYPNAEPRFQVVNLAKDIAVFILIPAFAILLFQSCDNSQSAELSVKPKRKVSAENQSGALRSQIIDFSGATIKKGKYDGMAERAPGTIIKLKLLNYVETYSNAPVHAIVIDNSLGAGLRGAILIGDASPDVTFERVNITFNFLKHPRNKNLAVPLSARALSLAGTLGINAKKKEGFFARAALGAAQNGLNNAQGSVGNEQSLKDALLKVFASGLLQESISTTSVEQNRANILVLSPSQTFYAELTDYFPRSN